MAGGKKPILWMKKACSQKNSEALQEKKCPHDIQKEIRMTWDNLIANAEEQGQWNNGIMP